jgi:hypothetical protein
VSRDLFSFADPEPEPEPAPSRAKPGKTGKSHVRTWNGHLIHDCFRCGAPNAVYGEGVRLMKDEPGTWWCAMCWRAEIAKRGSGR